MTEHLPAPAAPPPRERPVRAQVWVAVARHLEEGRERAEVVAAFSDVRAALAWTAASPVSMLVVPLVVDAELQTAEPPHAGLPAPEQAQPDTPRP